MPAQIGRLREVAAQDNVSLAIVPVETMLEIAPMNGFVILDDDVVEIDLMTTGLSTRGRKDVTAYRRIFDAFEARATTEIDPILDRHMERYLDLSRSGSRRSAAAQESGRGQA